MHPGFITTDRNPGPRCRNGEWKKISPGTIQNGFTRIYIPGCEKHWMKTLSPPSWLKTNLEGYLFISEVLPRSERLHPFQLRHYDMTHSKICGKASDNIAYRLGKHNPVYTEHIRKKYRQGNNYHNFSEQ